MPDDQATDTRGVIAWVFDHWKQCSSCVIGLVIVVAWVVHAEDSHRTQARSLPQINAALDKLTRQHEQEKAANEAKKQYIAEMCRAGEITSKLACIRAGVTIEEMGAASQ